MFLRSRLLSMAMVLTIAFVVMVCHSFSATVSMLGKWGAPYFPSWEVVGTRSIWLPASL